jgi:hypothetical protein
MEYDKNNNAEVITRNSNQHGTGLWKSVEKQENPAGCCSGCAGDYEDPDWSAWERDPDEGDEDTEGTGGRDKDREASRGGPARVRRQGFSK